MEIENSRKEEMPSAWPDPKFPDPRALSGGHPEKEFADSEGQQMSTLKPYKRSPALSNSSWYKGMLVSQMAGTADNNGAFDLIIGKIRRGTEPPPHVHSREHELFHLLSGEIKVFVDGKVFKVTAGECVFLPRRIPHPFLVTSDEIDWLAKCCDQRSNISPRGNLI